MKRNSDKRKKRAEFKGFLEFRPDAEQKAHLRQNVVPISKGLDVLQEIVEGGHKVSLSLDEYHSCLILSLTEKDPDGDNAGWVLTFRHVDPIVLITMAQFVVSDLCKDESWLSLQRDEKTVDW